MQLLFSYSVFRRRLRAAEEVVTISNDNASTARCECVRRPRMHENSFVLKQKNKQAVNSSGAA